MNLMSLIACASHTHISQSNLFSGQTLEFWKHVYSVRSGALIPSMVEGSIGILLDTLHRARDFEAVDPHDRFSRYLATLMRVYVLPLLCWASRLAPLSGPRWQKITMFITSSATEYVIDHSEVSLEKRRHSARRLQIP